MLILVLALWLAAPSAWAQKGGPAPAQSDSRATAYYHFSMGHLYLELAAAHGYRGEYVSRAIEHYKLALKADPGASLPMEELSDLYMQSGRLRDAVSEAEEMLRQNPENLDARRGLATLYSDLGDTKSALAMWQRLSEVDPNPRTLRALANAHEQARDYAAAVEAMRRAAQLAPQDGDIQRELAQYLLLAEKLDESLKLYQQLAAANPKDAHVQLRLSQIYHQKRDHKRARAAQDLAKTLDPNSLDIRFNEVNLLEAEGRTEEAVAGLKEILETTAKKSYSAAERSNRVIMLERLALLYRSSEQVAQAVETFQQMAQLDPELRARAAAQIIDTYRQGKEFAKAEQEAEAATRQYPADRTVILVRASLLADLGKIEPALAEVKRLFDGQNDREVHLTLAQIYDKARDYASVAQALDEVEKRSRAEDEKETVYFMRGAMYEKLKKLPEAEAEFRKVLRIHPDNASALNYLGYMLADRNLRLQEAHQLISRAVELEPHNGAFLDSLGWVKFRLGQLQEAEEYLRLALRRVSRDPIVHDHLGDVYFQQGKLKQAIAQWERSLKEWDAGSRAEHEPAEVAKIQKKLEGAKVRLAKESSKAVPPQR